MIETLNHDEEFEQRRHREHERKFMPLFPDELAEFRRSAMPIEQFYLSHPSEPFSLRFREQLIDDGTLRYTATLKDRGVIDENGIDRLEVEVDVPPELYHYYRSADTPVLRKLRCAANNNVAVDFFEDGSVLLESEHPIAWAQFIERSGERFADITGDKTADNEWRAHQDYRRNHSGRQTLLPRPYLTSRVMADRIASAFTRQSFVIAQVIGRSGSGKSTVVEAVQRDLRQRSIESIVISTDDYHRGASWLQAYNGSEEWTEWDHPIVYDTAAMAEDLDRLVRREVVRERRIDFTTVEPVFGDALATHPVILIEGIYAAAPEFAKYGGLRFDIETPLATCVGRRLLRDRNERPQFADLEKSLLYMLEQAEPMWRKQHEDKVSSLQNGSAMSSLN